jgi:hypothetical protein
MELIKQRKKQGGKGLRQPLLKSDWTVRVSHGAIKIQKKWNGCNRFLFWNEFFEGYGHPEFPCFYAESAVSGIRRGSFLNFTEKKMEMSRLSASLELFQR